MNATAIAKNLEVCKNRAAFWENAAAQVAALPPEAEVLLGDEFLVYTVAGNTSYLTFPDAAAPLRPGRLEKMRAASER